MPHRVTQCRIIASAVAARKRGEPEPEGSALHQATVMVVMDDGRGEQPAFRYYEDELSFQPTEFIGLTLDECRGLHHKRDVEYLRSS